MSRDYIAWLRVGNAPACSVARGSLAEVRAKARAVFETPLWQENHDEPTQCRITKGARQSFVESIIWRPIAEARKEG
jgi:hypothetical protein